MKLAKIFVVCFIAMPILLTISLFCEYPHLKENSEFDHGLLKEDKAQNVTSMISSASTDALIQSNVDDIEDSTKKLLGGLLSDGFDEMSCLSRYASLLHRKHSPHIPSSYLLSRLRRYEELHKRCSPNTESYTHALKPLTSPSKSDLATDCDYFVWISFSGIGNKILTLTSAFLYALLTNRVLLVRHEGHDVSDLFCEPFPGTSWLLPPKFPLNKSV